MADGSLGESLDQPLAEWLDAYRGSSEPVDVDLRSIVLRDLVEGGLRGEALDGELRRTGLLKMKGRKAARDRVEALRRAMARPFSDGRTGSEDAHSPAAPAAAAPAAAAVRDSGPRPRRPGAVAPRKTVARPRRGDEKKAVRKTAAIALPSGFAAGAHPAAADVRIGGKVPSALLDAFAAWDGSGVKSSTHSSYVKYLRTVFEHARGWGLPRNSSLHDAEAAFSKPQGMLCERDEKGFYKASLKKLIAFLEGGGSTGASGKAAPRAPSGKKSAAAAPRPKGSAARNRKGAAAHVEPNLWKWCAAEPVSALAPPARTV